MRVPFLPPPGLISDDTTFSADGAWADGSNVRPWRGQMQTIGGWELAFPTALTGVCRNLHSWSLAASGLSVAFGTHLELQVFAKGDLYTITPDGLGDGAQDSGGTAPGYGTGAYGEGTYSTPSSSFFLRTWSLDTWGDTLLAVPRGGTLYQWENDTAELAVAVSNAPDEITAMLVTPQRQVIALGCNEEASGDFNPLCIRGCDIEDLTNWTTAAGNNVFEHIIEGGGRIVAGKLIGTQIAVWTDNALYLGTFLGNPGQTYRFDRVDDNCGLIGPNAVIVFRGVAYWIAPDMQFRMWAPGGKSRIIPCPIRNDFANNLSPSQVAKIVASSTAQFDEIRFDYPDQRDGVPAENSRYVALSLSGETLAWYRGLMARSAYSDANVASHPMGVSPEGMVFNQEYGNNANGAALEWFVESADQYLGEGENLLQIQGCWPDFEDQQGDISLSIRVRMYPQSDAVTKGPFTLAAGQRKKDFRATGRVASVRWSGAAAPSFARFGKPSFEAVITGER